MSCVFVCDRVCTNWIFGKNVYICTVWPICCVYMMSVGAFINALCITCLPACLPACCVCERACVCTPSSTYQCHIKPSLNIVTVSTSHTIIGRWIACAYLCVYLCVYKSQFHHICHHTNVCVCVCVLRARLSAVNYRLSICST